jgi:hypothetical protein
MRAERTSPPRARLRTVEVETFRYVAASAIDSRAGDADASPRSPLDADRTKSANAWMSAFSASSSAS